MVDKNFFPAVGLTGGTTDDLDGIPVAEVGDGDKSFTYDTSELFFHNLNATSGVAESSPDTIAPDDVGGGDQRWEIIQKVRINATGASSFTIGSAGSLEYNQSSPAGTAVLGYNGYFYATRVYNAYLSDYADFLPLSPKDKLSFPGVAYVMTPEGITIPKHRCQEGIIGIVSDVYGHAAGRRGNRKEAAISVAGWVLAHVDKPYKPGTPLTNGPLGILTRMRFWEKILHPERMLGVYMYKEALKHWGPTGSQVVVNDRHWVKVR